MKTVLRVALHIDLHDFYGRAVSRGIHRFVRSHRSWVIDDVVSNTAADLERLRTSEADGIIFYPGHPRLVSFFKDWGIPSVSVSNSMPLGDGTPRVVTDDHAVGRLAAEHFLERGFRNFAYYSSKAELNVSSIRRSGFEGTLAQAGFACVTFQENSNVGKALRVEWDTQEIQECLRKGPGPLGVLCMNDRDARNIIRLCLAHDIRIPDEVAIVGVDNSEMSDGLAEMPFSSVELPTDNIGYTAMELLAGMVAGRKPPKEDVLLPPVRVVVRVSSDLLAIEDEPIARGLRLIRENALTPLQIDDIVRKVALSRRAFESRFKAAVGRSPYAEVLRLRVVHARGLLLDSNLTVAEVAEQSGFGHLKQFYTTFSKLTGTTPSKYRKSFQRPR